ncbi:MAG: hypothetical protein HOH12_14165 [Gammaproteobacteria bacterium]|nr:hypothetical protein [Gammaproteobacteria bacterium]
MVYLERFAYLDSGTLGKVWVGDWSCYTIERPWKNNASNVSCIPEGEYKCEPFTGTRFQDVVQILDVPDRTFILFHVANFPHDVQGCIGLGSRFNSDSLEPAVYDSRVTTAEFFVQAGKSFDLKIQGVRAEL